MKILIINPSLRLGSATKYLPVGIACVMSYIKELGFNFDLLDIDIDDLTDEEVETYIADTTYDVYLAGSIVTHYKWMKWLTNIIKKYNPNSSIIIGNSVAGSIPELFLKNSSADVAVIGEGEISTAETLFALKNKKSLDNIEGIAFKSSRGQIKINPKRKAEKKLDDFPMIEWNMFNTHKYFEKSYANILGVNNETLQIKAMPVSTARGCSHRCTFCHFVFWNDPFRYRSPESIVREIKRNQDEYGCEYINLWDDLSVASLPQGERLADEIIRQGIKFHWNASVRVDLFGNPKFEYSRRLEIAQKFYEAGCRSLGFSLESGNKEILEMMNKRIEPKYFYDHVQILDKVGIVSKSSVVFGYPIETKETIKETFEQCYNAGVYPSIGYLLPLPATGMYEYAKNNNFITDEDAFLDSITERQDLCVNMTQMSDEEVLNTIEEEALKLNDKLNIGLTKETLIKTGGERNYANSKLKNKKLREPNSLSLNYNESVFK